MQIREIECFQAIMTAGTMTRASQMLGISQPAVSNTIATLEHRLGFKLFLRKSGRLQPTPEALIFNEDAQRMLEAVVRTNEAALRLRHGERGHLTISAFPGVSIRVLPEIIGRFLETREDVKIRLLSRSSHIVIEQLPSQMFDIAIAERPSQFVGVDAETVSYECCCVLAKDHPLARHDVLTPELLDGVPFAALFRDHMTTYQLRQAFSAVQAVWNVTLEAQYFASLIEYVRASNAVALIDPINSQGFTEGLVTRPFKPAVQYQIGVLTPQDKPLSKVAESFLEHLRVELRR
ncbi:LysR family transcriptional regulator [Roseovarius rhodophyticola]|uniref:LysR substrate-binding domain-containing protein n=1 Tax=Roseovarius rhodophyticola TaxID=3080827 RepID=A0ABZ2TKM5_9RHOB|nr:LysR substrate-binding domain-containing protein [Roseovarius sp. W115]MDV2927961.1 LysR substrate-binding domain-containing protein [Roseovarius sp. W115]